MAQAMKEEADSLIENKVEYLKDNPEGVVVFLYINHELNLLDPIGCCYPGITNEYSVYVENIINIYKKQAKNNLGGSLSEFIWAICDSIGTPYPTEEEIQKTVGRIIKILDDFSDNKYR